MKNRNVVEIYYFTFSTAIHFNTYTQPRTEISTHTFFYLWHWGFCERICDFVCECACASGLWVAWSESQVSKEKKKKKKKRKYQSCDWDGNASSETTWNQANDIKSIGGMKGNRHDRNQIHWRFLLFIPQ